MRVEKQLLLDEICGKIAQSQGFIVVGYKGFTSSRTREFRDRVAAVGGEFEVVKKRVFIKAAEAVGISFQLGEMGGHVALLFAERDPFALAKLAVQFGKENEETLVALGGHIDGQVCTAREMGIIAELPGRKEMCAQLLGLLVAPLGQLVHVAQAVLTTVPCCLDQKERKG